MLMKMFEKRPRGYGAMGYARDEAPLGLRELKNEDVVAFLPSLCRVRAGLTETSSSVHALPSPASALKSLLSDSSLFGWFTVLRRSPTPPRRTCQSYGFRLLGRSAPLPGADALEVSRFSCMKFLGVPGVFDYAGPEDSRLAPCPILPSRIISGSASGLLFSQLHTQPTDASIYASRPPHDGQRKTRGQVVRYSFPVRLFHPLLHAGLSRRSWVSTILSVNLCDASDLPSLQCVHASGCLVPCRAQTTFSEISWNVLSFSIVFR